MARPAVSEPWHQHLADQTLAGGQVHVTSAEEAAGKGDVIVTA